MVHTITAFAVIVSAVELGACAGNASASRTTTPLVVTAADLTPSSRADVPPAIAPELLEPHRLTGEKTIIPDGDTIAAVYQSGVRLIGSFKYCLDVEGHVSRVVVLKTTRVPSYDERIINEMNRWAFTPVILDGKPIPVCSAATFIFTAR